MNGRRTKRLRRVLEERMGAGHPKLKQALKAVKRLASRGTPQPAPKFEEPRRHKTKDSIAPTWPRTENQHAQGRPLIVLHPNRAPSKEARAERRKTAASKSMDRPHLVQLRDRGYEKLQRFFTSI